MGIHLLSCGTCKRQLDVTALRLGDEICCVCDAVLTVGHPETIELDEASGGAIRKAAFRPIPCNGECPRCEGDLRVHLTEDAGVIECKGCGGIWAQRDAFEGFIQSASSSTGADHQGAGIQPDAVETADWSEEGFVPCLTCGREMVRRLFRYAENSSDITLDVCAQHGIWFDEDELRRALEFVKQVGGGFDPSAAHLERGVRPLIVTGKTARERFIDGERDEGFLGGLFAFDGVEIVGWMLVALLE